MYQIGEQIVYNTTGVCQVAAIGAQGDNGRSYYTLVPEYGTETIFVPVDTKMFMRPILSRAEAEALIAQIPGIEVEPQADKNLQHLGRYYQEAFQTHTCSDLIRLIKTIYIRNTDARKSNRKPYKLDETYLKRAEDLLHGELAISLGIPREDVLPYIDQLLQSSGSSYAPEVDAG